MQRCGAIYLPAAGNGIVPIVNFRLPQNSFSGKNVYGKRNVRQKSGYNLVPAEKKFPQRVLLKCICISPYQVQRPQCSRSRLILITEAGLLGAAPAHHRQSRRWYCPSTAMRFRWKCGEEGHTRQLIVEGVSFFYFIGIHRSCGQTA